MAFHSEFLKFEKFCLNFILSQNDFNGRFSNLPEFWCDDQNGEFINRSEYLDYVIHKKANKQKVQRSVERFPVFSQPVNLRIAKFVNKTILH